MIYRLVKGPQNTPRFTQNVTKMSRLNATPAFDVSRLKLYHLSNDIRQFKMDLEGLNHENFGNSTIQYFEKRLTRHLRHLIWSGFEQLLSGSNFCGVLEGPYTSR